MASRVVRLDGRTGEGGGQLVRVAVALAALTGTPLRVDNVRGNRQGKRGGGKLGIVPLPFCADFHKV